MVQPVVLDREQLRSILSLYHLDNLEDYGGMPRSGVNTSYWVRVDGKRFWLRITSQKRIQDMIYEKELLAYFKQAGLPVPLLVENVAKGTFLPWSTRGRYVSLFEEMSGRQLGVFELRAKHTKDIGAFVAKVHKVSTKFEKKRSNPFGVKVIHRQLKRLVDGLDKKRLAKRFTPDVELLSEALSEYRNVSASLPKGIIHGELFVENARFSNGRLCGVNGFERAANECLAWDLAVLMCTWCWLPTVEQAGGPSGAFSAQRLAGLFEGYRTIRNINSSEFAALPALCRLIACRFAITRLVDFELSRRAKRWPYRDYRHFVAMLRKLQNGGAEKLLEPYSG